MASKKSKWSARGTITDSNYYYQCLDHLYLPIITQNHNNFKTNDGSYRIIDISGIPKIFVYKIVKISHKN